MLSVIMLSVIMINVVMLSVVAPPGVSVTKKKSFANSTKNIFLRY
jgi:hypothetical protein